MNSKQQTTINEEQISQKIIQLLNLATKDTKHSIHHDEIFLTILVLLVQTSPKTVQTFLLQTANTSATITTPTTAEKYDHEVSTDILQFLQRLLLPLKTYQDENPISETSHDSLSDKTIPSTINHSKTTKQYMTRLAIRALSLFYKSSFITHSSRTTSHGIQPQQSSEQLHNYHNVSSMRLKQMYCFHLHLVMDIIANRTKCAFENNNSLLVLDIELIEALTIMLENDLWTICWDESISLKTYTGEKIQQYDKEYNQQQTQIPSRQDSELWIKLINIPEIIVQRYFHFEKYLSTIHPNSDMKNKLSSTNSSMDASTHIYDYEQMMNQILESILSHQFSNSNTTPQKENVNMLQEYKTIHQFVLLSFLTVHIQKVSYTSKAFFTLLFDWLFHRHPQQHFDDQLNNTIESISTSGNNLDKSFKSALHSLLLSYMITDIQKVQNSSNGDGYGWNSSNQSIVLSVLYTDEPQVANTLNRANIWNLILLGISSLSSNDIVASSASTSTSEDDQTLNMNEILHEITKYVGDIKSLSYILLTSLFESSVQNNPDHHFLNQANINSKKYIWMKYDSVYDTMSNDLKSVLQQDQECRKQDSFGDAKFLCIICQLTAGELRINLGRLVDIISSSNTHEDLDRHHLNNDVLYDSIAKRIQYCIRIINSILKILIDFSSFLLDDDDDDDVKKSSSSKHDSFQIDFIMTASSVLYIQSSLQDTLDATIQFMENYDEFKRDELVYDAKATSIASVSKDCAYACCQFLGAYLSEVNIFDSSAMHKGLPSHRILKAVITSITFMCDNWSQELSGNHITFSYNPIILFPCISFILDTSCSEENVEDMEHVFKYLLTGSTEEKLINYVLLIMTECWNEWENKRESNIDGMISNEILNNVLWCSLLISSWGHYLEIWMNTTNDDIQYFKLKESRSKVIENVKSIVRMWLTEMFSQVQIWTTNELSKSVMNATINSWESLEIFHTNLTTEDDKVKFMISTMWNGF